MKLINDLENMYNYFRAFDYNKCLNTEIPFLFSHPLFNSVACKFDDEIKILKQDNYNEYVEKMIDEIESDFDYYEIDDSIRRLLFSINKPYRLDVFNILCDNLSDKVYNEILSWIWSSTEFPHQSGIMKINRLFKKIIPRLFMNKDDLEVFNNLPDKIKVYRGLQGSKSKIKALSWTLSLEKAKWFANRFSFKGDVFEMEIDKKNIYAYINSIGEKEIILNSNFVRNYEKI